jgi:peptidoglycan/LPS O-acetylase OafA/YrhL
VSYCVFAEGIFARLLDRPAMRFLGRVSYSFYVYHYLVLGFLIQGATRLFDATTLTREPLLPQIAITLLTIVLTLPLSAISYRWVEQPMISVGRRLLRSRQAVTEGKLAPAQ